MTKTLPTLLIPAPSMQIQRDYFSTKGSWLSEINEESPAFFSSGDGAMGVLSRAWGFPARRPTVSGFPPSMARVVASCDYFGGPAPASWAVWVADSGGAGCGPAITLAGRSGTTANHWAAWAGVTSSR